MLVIDFNSGWACHRLEEPGSSVPVSIPHDAMLAEPRHEMSAGGVNTGWFEGHDYRYAKTLTVPSDWANKTAILEFEGVYHNAEVWVNGKQAAFRPYGYTNFYVELNPWLNYGEDNEISVIARNADQPNSRWYSGAGLYRPVWLHLGPREYLPPNAVKVRTLSTDPPEVEIRVAAVGSGPVRLTAEGGGYTAQTVIPCVEGSIGAGGAVC